MAEQVQVNQTLRLEQLTANGKDFIAVLLRLASDGKPQLLIGLSDEDGKLVNDLMVNDPDDLQSTRTFFAKVIGLIDLATDKSGAAVN